MDKESNLFKLLINNSFSRQELNSIIVNYEKDLVTKAISDIIANQDYNRKVAERNREKRKENFFNVVLSDIDAEISKVKEKYKNYEFERYYRNQKTYSKRKRKYKKRKNSR